MKITMYTRINPPCSYCEGAKLFLQDNGQVYEEIIIGKHIMMEEFVETHPDVRTIPLVIIDGVKVGGYAELKKHFEAKKALEGLSI